MQQNNPQLWLTVRSVTLIDKSEASLQRAREIAEVLFPVAKGRVVTCGCDFKSQERIQARIPSSFVYTSRLHLVSNVIDLLSEDQLRQFARSQKEICVRSLYGKNLFNDIFVVFSPEYRNWDWVSTKLKMNSYREAWGNNASDIAVRGGEPDSCVYATFELNDLKKSAAYRAYADGNRCLRNLVKERNRCMDDGCDDGALKGLHKALNNVEISGANFFACYEWADVQIWKGHVGQVLFVPKDNTHISPCVICFREQDIDIKKRAWEEILKKADLKCFNANELASFTKKLIWKCEDRIFSGDTDFSMYQMERPYNFSNVFVIHPRGAEPLPDIDSMDRKQKDVILGRAQLRRIRGGAGCGKTTTMLWHGVMSILRTHKPVLMASRTVTLFNHNQRRMAATLLKQIQDLEYVERDLISFRTIDKYLCEHIDSLNDCGIRHCGACKRRLHDQYERDNSDDRIVPAQCINGNARLQNCTVLLNWKDSPEDIDRNLTKWEKDELCKACKRNAVNGLCAKESKFLSDAKMLGAVMVDEIQSIEPEKVQALYNLTEAGNPYREFYAFCDERQCLKTESLESDAAVNGKFRVKTPNAGGGRRFNPTWITMTKPYRQVGDMSGVLIEVAREFQKLANQKYGDNETEHRPFQPGLANVFSVERGEAESLYEAVARKIRQLQQSGESRITVVCERPQTVRRFLKRSPSQPWRSTHAVVESFKEEQRLRNDFEESENHIGLTTIELVQGWDLENVILVVENDCGQNPHEIESVTTGITRAKSQLRVIDASPSGWVYATLNRFNQ